MAESLAGPGQPANEIGGGTSASYPTISPRSRPTIPLRAPLVTETKPAIESIGSAPSVGEGVPDTYSKFVPTDFTVRWRGLARATKLEQTLIGRLLSEADTTRVFELGTGTGRLTPAFARGATEYVGVDLDLDLLRNVGEKLPKGLPRLLVHANLVHLPFVDGSASFAGLIRIYNHLTRPETAFAEMHRLLAPGGRFVATASVRPTLATVELDLNEFLKRPAGVPFRGITLRRAPVVERHAGRMVVFFPTQAQLDSVVARSGARVQDEYGVGFHDLYLLRRAPIPTEVIIDAGHKRPRSRLFPMRWIVGSWGERVPRPLPPLAESLACPRCRTAVGPVDFSADWTRDCGVCGFTLRYRDAVLEAVWDGRTPARVGTN